MCKTGTVAHRFPALRLPRSHSQGVVLNPRTAPATVTDPGPEGSAVPSKRPSRPESPSQVGIPEKGKLPQRPTWVTGVSEAVVLAFRARLHRHAQVPVGDRHCGLARRWDRVTGALTANSRRMVKAADGTRSRERGTAGVNCWEAWSRPQGRSRQA